MNKEPIIVILAAGMGSRYGGLKQIDIVGNNNEIIIDFTIYDAIRAGFKRLGLIIRKEHKELFDNNLVNKIKDKIDIFYIYQDLKDIPDNYNINVDRTKPWGTTHALLVCKSYIDSPFMICNADDYYGRDAFVKMYQYLKNDIKDNNYCMIGYDLINTLTLHGSVTRGICVIDDNELIDIKEISNIRKNDGIVEYLNDDKWEVLDNNTKTSMNFWGFTCNIFDDINEIFIKFLDDHINSDPLNCEHVIPTAINDLIKLDKANVYVIESNDAWFGVTYKEDKEYVFNKLIDYKSKGIYPFDLWK